MQATNYKLTEKQQELLDIAKRAIVDASVAFRQSVERQKPDVEYGDIIDILCEVYGDFDLMWQLVYKA